MRLNDIEAVQNFLLDFTCYVQTKVDTEEELEHMFDDTFASVRKMQAEMVEIISIKMNRDSQAALLFLLERRQGIIQIFSDLGQKITFHERKRLDLVT